jgi:hypothetical protein
LVVARDIEALIGSATPAANSAFARLDPAVAGEALGHASQGHPVLNDGLDRFGDDPIGIDGIGTKKRRLEAERVLTGGAMMDTDAHSQEYGMVQLNVDGGAEGIPDAC